MATVKHNTCSVCRTDYPASWGERCPVCCPDCEGSGWISIPAHTSTALQCSRCEGTGKKTRKATRAQ